MTVQRPCLAASGPRCLPHLQKDSVSSSCCRTAQAELSARVGQGWVNSDAESVSLMRQLQLPCHSIPGGPVLEK